MYNEKYYRLWGLDLQNKDIPYILKLQNEKLKPSYISFVFFMSEMELGDENLLASPFQTEKQKAEAIAKEVEGTPKSKKQRWSWIFLVLNVLIVGGIFVYQMFTGGVKPISEFFNYIVYYRFLTVACIMFGICVIADAVKFYLLIHKTTKKRDFKLSYKTSALGRYWDAITPLSAGGEPFQIYYMNKHGYKVDVASGISLAKSLFWQIGFICIGIIVLLFANTGDLGLSGTFVKVAAWIGVGANALMFFLIILVSTSKKIGSRLIGGTLKLLYKMKIVKDYGKALRKVVTFVKNYQKCIKNFFSSFWTVVSQLFLSIIGSLAQWSIAYFIYLAFNYNAYLAGEMVLMSWFDIMALAAICDSAASFIPSPGGSGAAEISFLAVFATLVPDQTAFWALLFWRGISYYSFIIQGFILTFIDFIKGKKRAVLGKEINNNEYQGE